MLSPWSNTEVELIVADYFNMLSLELKGERYSKAEHRRALMPLLDNRSDGSIEFKHQNISAVLSHLGIPPIKGYLPRFNYQLILEDVVIRYLVKNPEIEIYFEKFANKTVKLENKFSYEKLIIDLPESDNIFDEPKINYKSNPIKVNYLEKEQRNQKLGSLGEEFVYDYEKWSLKQQGRNKFADQVRYVSKEEGDGAGFDILSKDLRGNDKFIEVKTTKLTQKTPIFFSKNELDFSISNKDKFYLYRLFSFEKEPHMFIKQGALNQICQSEALAFKGYF